MYKKSERSNPSNYRPVSLLSIVDKLLEKLMYKRLYSFLHNNSLLYNYQFGFRTYHSTALVELIDNQETIIGMYFDLQKAFGTVDHEILLTKLYNYDVRGPINDWFRDYLTNRKQFVAIGENVSELGMIRCGVRQGSVLGPLLFFIHVNDICNISDECTVKLFADDTNVFVFGKDSMSAFCTANTLIVQLNMWFVANKLSPSIDKTCYSVFGRRNHNYTVDSVINLNDNVLPEVDKRIDDCPMPN